MTLGRLQYFLQTALSAIGRAPSMALLSAASVGMVLVMMGTYGMTVFNLERLTLVWGRAAHLSCVLDGAMPEGQWQAAADAIGKIEGVGKTRLVTPKEALARFATRSNEARALVDGVDPSILPATVELSLVAGDMQMAHVAAIAQHIEQVAGVSSVDFGADVIARLRRLVQVLRWGGFATGVMLAVATVFLLSNTIRLTVYARREEITILRLVGATPFFVRMPFLLEGALWGLGGGLMGVAGLYCVHAAVAAPLTAALSALTGGLHLTLYHAPVAWGMLGAGLVLGVLGSALALRRFLDTEAL